MKKLTLRRRYFPEGTYSTLHDEQGKVVCYMVERPWLNNRQAESCVPEGTYNLVPHESPKFGSVYALSSPDLGVTVFGPSLRTHILIHKANVPSELQGCLAPGTALGFLKGQWGVSDSTSAFNHLISLLDGKEAELTIVRD